MGKMRGFGAGFKGYVKIFHINRQAPPAPGAGIGGFRRAQGCGGAAATGD